MHMRSLPKKLYKMHIMRRLHGFQFVCIKINFLKNFYLRGQVIEVFHPLIYSLNGCNSES